MFELGIVAAIVVIASVVLFSFRRIADRMMERVDSRQAHKFQNQIKPAARAAAKHRVIAYRKSIDAEVDSHYSQRIRRAEKRQERALKKMETSKKANRHINEYEKQENILTALFKSREKERRTTHKARDARKIDRDGNNTRGIRRS